MTILVDDTGIIIKEYRYDAFGNEKDPDGADTNYFRYCGEYFDLSSGTYYLRARYYSPGIGRFTQEDTHWNPSNMIYGDNPTRINERLDPLGLTIYTYAPDINAIKQSTNLYVYCGNNPVMYIDKDGEIFMLVTGAVGAVVGGVAGGIYSYAKYGEVRWQNVVGGAAIGGAIGLTGGAAAAVLTTGSVTASTGAVIAGLSTGVTTAAGAGAGGAVVYKTLEKGVNFTQTTLQRMQDPNRFVPVQTLIDAIKNGVAKPDPQGTKAIMYTIEMFRNGKAYQLEVLYDKASNTILHFLYK